MRAENLPLFQSEISAQTLDDLRSRSIVDLQTNCVSLASIVQLRSHRLQQVARFFLLQVEIAVACYAKGGRRDDLVSAIHLGRMRGHKIGEENVIVRAFVGGHAQNARQRTRHRNHAHVNG